MAKYTTTTEELTSIADAIRTKTGGNSSLIYPTGFVSAINLLSTTSIYSPWGEDMEFVLTLYNLTLSLDDTTFSSWTPSTSYSSNIMSDNIISSYTPIIPDQLFMLLTKVKILYNYATEVENKSKILELYYIGITFILKNFTGADNFINGNRTYYAYMGGPVFLDQLFYDSSGYLGMTGNAYGFYIINQSPSISNLTSSTPTIAVKLPNIRANASSNYMSITNFQALDTANTTINMVTDLYATSSNKTTLASVIFDGLHNMYAELHTTI